MRGKRTEKHKPQIKHRKDTLSDCWPHEQATSPKHGVLTSHFGWSGYALVFNRSI